MAKNDKIIEHLIQAYWKEMETVLNYIANAQNLDGIRAEEVKKALQEDIAAEIGHAQSIAKRIHVIGGVVPGSLDFKPQQKALQPPKDSTDILSVIKGVLAAEEDAIKLYSKLIKICDGVDYPTQDLCVTLLADEEEHYREFQGFLKEYNKKS